GEVAEPIDQTDEVADAVAVSVLEGLDVELVDDRVLVTAVAHGRRRYHLARACEADAGADDGPLLPRDCNMHNPTSTRVVGGRAGRPALSIGLPPCSRSDPLPVPFRFSSGSLPTGLPFPICFPFPSNPLSLPI